MNCEPREQAEGLEAAGDRTLARHRCSSASHRGCSLHVGRQRPGETLHSTGEYSSLPPSPTVLQSRWDHLRKLRLRERVAGLRSQRTNTTGQPELATRPRSSVFLNCLKETRGRMRNYPCLATEDIGEKNFRFHYLTPSTKGMEKLRTKVKYGLEAGPWG